MKSLYILNFGDRVKIGVSKDVEQRIKKLEYGSGSICEEYIKLECISYLKVEYMLHRIYSKYRTIGEYFNIDYKEACLKAKEVVEKYGNSITKNKKIRRRYNEYGIINREVKSLYEKIGATYYGHLIILIQNMSPDNSIDYSILPVSQQTLKTIKKKFKEENIIVKGKLGNTMKYYINPDISTYSENFDTELQELFITH